MKIDLKTIINAKLITKTFAEGKLSVEVLKGVSLEIKSGEMVAIVGRSGSGKSTLLHILGGLDRPSSGRVIIRDIDLHKISEVERGKLRNKYLGFVYQFHHLLPEFSALENVAMPLLIGDYQRTEVLARAHAILSSVGLENRKLHRVGELSGGERQRVAIARALVTNPAAVLADEPTGNLDHKTAEQIYELLFRLKQDFNTAFLLVTHDTTIASKMIRTLVLEDGMVVG